MKFSDMIVSFKGDKMSFAQFAYICWYKSLQVVELKDELLPPGEWPRRENSEDPSQSDNVSFIDRGRLVFLRSLGVMARTCRLNDRYTGYVVQSHKGLLALVESLIYGNALYVFNADTPNWEETAQLTKLEILTGQYPEFIRRVCHNDGWKDEILSLIYQEPPKREDTPKHSRVVITRKANGVTYQTQVVSRGEAEP